MVVKVLMLAEVEVKHPGELQNRLDAFREAVLPTQNWGIHLSRATSSDVRGFLPEDVNELLHMADTMFIGPIKMGPDYTL